MKGKKRYSMLLLVSVFVSFSCQNKKSHEQTSSIDFPATISFQNGDMDLSKEQLQQIVRKIDTCFAKKRDSAGFNGCMLVAYKGNVVYTNYCGVEDKVTNKPIDKNSIFQIASTSKTFTSAAILYLYQEGKLSIYDTLGKYFTDFPYRDIRICDLMCHRSGLPNYLHFINDIGYDTLSVLTNKRLLSMLYHFKPEMLALPNTKFAYNNTNYALLALIVEQVSGLSFGDFLTNAFFKPCKMKHTFLYEPNKPSKYSTTIGYLHKNVSDSLAPPDGIFGDKNIYSTLDDMLHWDRALRSGKLLEDSLITLAYTPRSFEKQGIKNYGYGWRLLLQPDSSYLVYHNGWWHGYTSAFYRNIEKDITIIVLSNMLSKTTYKVQEVWDAFLGSGHVALEDD